MALRSLGVKSPLETFFAVLYTSPQVQTVGGDAGMRFFPETLEDWETEIAESAAYFTSVTFHGRGVYERRQYTGPISEAIASAQDHANETGRVAMVYAVRGVHGVLIGIAKPERRR